MSRCRPVLALALLVGAAVLPTAAPAATLQGAVALDGITSATGIGDVNGDGFDDIGAANGTVIWGSANPSPVNANDLGTSGARFTRSGSAAQVLPVRAGDVDGDGIDDFASVNGAGGSVTVVYGAAGRGGIDIASGSRVTVVKTGPATGSVEAVGDFDGDGYDDLAVSRQTSTATDPSLRGGVTIVLGGPRVASIDANAQSPRTVIVNGTTSCQIQWLIFVPVGYRCVVPFVWRTAGDVDGDGKDDLYYDTGRDDGRYLLLGRTGAGGTLMAGSSPSGGWIKLQPFPGSSYASYNWAPVRVGDLDGDGKDDLVVQRYNGTLNDTVVLRGRAGLTGGTLDVGQPSLRLPAKSLDALGPAGDVDGDGTADLTASVRGGAGTSIGGAETDDLGVLAHLGGRADGSAVDASELAPVPGVPLAWGWLRSRPPVAAPAGDVDGDGKADLLVPDDAGRTILAVRAADRVAPELLLDRRTLGAASTVPYASIEPQPLRPGAASIRIALKEAATVTFTVRRGDTTVGSFERALPKWQTEVAWDGRIDGTDLPAGDYTLALTPRDAAGNVGTTRTLPFTVSSGEAAAPATVSFRATFAGPDGAALAGGTVNANVDCQSASGQVLQPVYVNAAAAGSTVPITGPAFFAGTSCTVRAGAAVGPAAVAGCTWDSTPRLNGETLPGGDATLVGGANAFDVTLACNGGRYVTTQPPGQLSTGRWQPYGSAVIPPASNTATLTSKANQSGAIVWPDAFDPNGWEYDLNSTMSGGNGQAEGITFSFIPATAALPAPGLTPLGGSGGALGIGGIPATSIALDAYGNPGDPASAFVGIAERSTATGLTYSTWADPGVRLRGATVWLKVVIEDGVITVWVNGKQRLQRAVALPDRVRLAVTGSTGTIFQSQVVGGVIVVPAS